MCVLQLEAAVVIVHDQNTGNTQLKYCRNRSSLKGPAARVPREGSSCAPGGGGTATGSPVEGASLGGRSGHWRRVSSRERRRVGMTEGCGSALDSLGDRPCNILLTPWGGVASTLPKPVSHFFFENQSTTSRGEGLVELKGKKMTMNAKIVKKFASTFGAGLLCWFC